MAGMTEEAIPPGVVLFDCAAARRAPAGALPGKAAGTGPRRTGKLLSP